MCGHTASPRCIRCPGSDQSSPKRLTLAAGIRLTRKKWPAASRYLAVSKAVADVHRRAGLGKGIEVVPNFIDEPDDPVVPPPKSGTILFVGPERGVKGLDVLLDAHRLLIDRGQAITLHHVGGATVGDEGHIVRAGHLHGSELESAFDSARLVVVPSTWQEPCPTVALEAMAAGRALIASAVGGLLDIIENGVTGLLVPPNDPTALADALESVINDTQRLEGMGAAGRTRLKEFSTGSVGPLIEAAYKSVLFARKTPA
jgi:glycogen(starch) synthase